MALCFIIAGRSTSRLSGSACAIKHCRSNDLHTGQRLKADAREFDQRETGVVARSSLAAWGFFARRPRAYHLLMRFAAQGLAALVRGRGSFRSLPMAGGWTRHRDLPAPQGRTFQQLWAEQKKGIAPDV